MSYTFFEFLSNIGKSILSFRKIPLLKLVYLPNFAAKLQKNVGKKINMLKKRLPLYQ